MRLVKWLLVLMLAINLLVMCLGVFGMGAVVTIRSNVLEFVHSKGLAETEIGTIDTWLRSAEGPSKWIVFVGLAGVIASSIALGMVCNEYAASLANPANKESSFLPRR